MSKVLTVFGATGNQGGSVVKTILADPVISKEFKIRAVTRDASKPAAKALASQGVEIVVADMSSKESIAPVVRGAHTVFLVTNFWDTMSAETEVLQGKAVSDASKAAGVKHIIFSSLIGVKEATGGRLSNLSYFDSKAEIEKYILNSGVPATFVLAGFFMSNFFESIRKNEDGTYLFAIPMSVDKARVPIFDAAGDTGKFVKIAIKNFPRYTGKHLYAATEYLSPQRLISDFSDAIGKPANVVQIPGETFKSFVPEPVAQPLLENMLLLEDVGYYGGADLTETLDLLDEKPTTWSKFVEVNKAKWL